MADLPALLAALIDACGAAPVAPASEVSLRQAGRMRDDGQAPWRNFRARQKIAVERPEFVWRARTGPVGLVCVTDALEGGEGRLEVRLGGLLPLVKFGPDRELTRGQLMRYLAELPWCPDALIANRQIAWEQTGARELAARLSLDGVTAAVTLTVDGSGRIVRIFAPDRPRTVGKVTVPTPWEGHFGDYRRHCGRWLPFRGEVGWWLGGNYVPCWQATITEWRRERQREEV